MIDWQKIDTVLLDMDGTLLDLHFDNHFWQVHVPQRYAQKHGLSLEAAEQDLRPRFRNAEGTLDWYCVDYWTRELDLDIALLKQEVEHLIGVHPHVPEFLSKLRLAGKQLVLVTNAHNKSLALKFKHTRLGEHFHHVICSHDLGAPKEHPHFWERLQEMQPFSKHASLLIDDSLPVLRAARAYGIAQLLAVKNPDSQAPPKDHAEFAAITSFLDIMP